MRRLEKAFWRLDVDMSFFTTLCSRFENQPSPECAAVSNVECIKAAVVSSEGRRCVLTERVLCMMTRGW